VSIPRPYRAPIRREGRRIDKWARKNYGISGQALLAKLGRGEGNFAPGRSNPSKAGARGAYQFMPATRNAILKETGADAYGSPAEQTRAARIYLRRGGLRGYNPGGGQQYVDYILNQKVGNVRRQVSASEILEPYAQRAERVRQRQQSLPVDNSQVSAARTMAIISFLHDHRPNRVLNLKQTLDAIPEPSEPAKSPTTPRAGRSPRSGLPDARGTGGSISLGPNADRPGVKTKGSVKRFARRISALAGEPLTIGTGTNHKQMTVDGNLSQHWTGDAGDIPAKGEHLIRLGQDALIAAGMPRKKARKQRGGLYNIGGKQIIFNTHQGGDHTDHLHIGI